MNSITSFSRGARLVGAAFTALLLLAGSALMFDINGIAHAASSEPVISAVTVAPSATTATVTWTTDEDSNSQIAYGTSVPYTATTTLDTNMVTSHSETLTGLSTSTTYHYEVISTDGSGNTNMSVDSTFGTTATATPSLSLTTTSGTPGTVITVNGSGFSPNETVTLSANDASTSVTVGSGGAFSTTWTVPSVSAGNLTLTATGSTGDTSNATFNVTSGTTTSSTTVSSLMSELTTLEQQFQSVISSLNNMGISVSGTGVMNTAASIDQNGQSFSAGGTIDFGGHNFNHEENVTVALNGDTVATAHADGGGNFSTGSLTVPSTPGTYTYTFTGASGDSATATITVTQ